MHTTNKTNNTTNNNNHTHNSNRDLVVVQAAEAAGAHQGGLVAVLVGAEVCYTMLHCTALYYTNL